MLDFLIQYIYFTALDVSYTQFNMQYMWGLFNITSQHFKDTNYMKDFPYNFFILCLS